MVFFTICGGDIPYDMWSSLQYVVMVFSTNMWWCYLRYVVVFFTVCGSGVLYKHVVVLFTICGGGVLQALTSSTIYDFLHNVAIPVAFTETQFVAMIILH